MEKGTQGDSLGLGGVGRYITALLAGVFPPAERYAGGQRFGAGLLLRRTGRRDEIHGRPGLEGKPSHPEPGLGAFLLDARIGLFHPQPLSGAGAKVRGTDGGR